MCLASKLNVVMFTDIYLKKKKSGGGDGGYSPNFGK